MEVGECCVVSFVELYKLLFLFICILLNIRNIGDFWFLIFRFY